MFSLQSNTQKQGAQPQSQHFSKQGQANQVAASPTTAPRFFTETQPLALLQPSLSIGQANDVYEREADAVATAITSNRPVQPILSSGRISSVQRQSANDTPSVPANLQSQLNSSKGSGRALPTTTRSSMETAIGANFSDVRIHTDTAAEQMNRDIGARAFTHGPNIYFNAGEYNANSLTGRHLLAHELTHVVQQGGTKRTLQRKPKKQHLLNIRSLTPQDKKKGKKAKEKLLKAIKKLKSINAFLKDQRQVQMQKHIMAILSSFQSAQDIGTYFQKISPITPSKIASFNFVSQRKTTSDLSSIDALFMKLFVSHNNQHGENAHFKPEGENGGALIFNIKMINSNSVGALAGLISHEMLHLFSHVIRGIKKKRADRGIKNNRTFGLIDTTAFKKYKLAFKKHFTNVLNFLNAQQHRKTNPLPTSLIDKWVWRIVEEKITDSYQYRIDVAEAKARKAMTTDAPYPRAAITFLDKYLINRWITDAQDHKAMRSAKGKALMKTMDKDIKALHAAVEKQLGK